MPWNDTARVEHRRDAVRYPSDLTGREWELIAPLLPLAKRGGRPRTTDLRAVTDAILYIASSGCQSSPGRAFEKMPERGRMLPKDFPPVSTVQGYFYAWRDTGLWQSINHLLVMSARELEGREASPSAGVIDSQSVKTTESGGVGKSNQFAAEAKDAILIRPLRAPSRCSPPVQRTAALPLT